MRTIFKRKNSHLRAALHLSRNNVTLAVVDVRDRVRPDILQVWNRNWQNENERKSVLEELKSSLQQNKWQQLSGFCLMDDEDYQLVQVDVPDVPESEYNAALLWSLSDLITIDTNDVAIQSFCQPGQKFLYVAAASKNRIRQLVDTMMFLGITPTVIDIPELSYRNYLDSYFQNDKVIERGIALVILRKNEGIIYIYQSGNLCFSRRFLLEYEDNQAAFPEEELMLELQRSIDYYERQMRQPPPAKILVTGWVGQSTTLAVFKDNFQQDVDCLPENKFSDEVVSSALMGCVLRQEVA